MPGVSAGNDGPAMTQPGFESREMSPGDCGSLKTNPSLGMLRNMKVYMIGTREGRSTAPGAKEYWTLARDRDASHERFVRAGMPGLVEGSSIAGPLVCSSGFVRSAVGDPSRGPSDLARSTSMGWLRGVHRFGREKAGRTAGLVGRGGERVGFDLTPEPVRGCRETRPSGEARPG